MKMKKRFASFLLIMAMAMAMLSPALAREVKAQETAGVSEWAVSVLIFGDTYGIYPLKWYDMDLTENIKKDQLRTLLFGVRRKIVETKKVAEVRDAKAYLDDSITVQEAIEAFYTVLSNYDYPFDLGFDSGQDAVSLFTELGIYTGEYGEQGLQELCSIEQAMVMATRIVMIFYEALEASSKGFFWKLESGGNTVYLLGSLHMADEDLYPLSLNIWSAFIDSDALVVEANLFDQEDLLATQNMIFLMDGSSLKDHLSEETYKKVIEVAELIGYSEEMVSLLKPWAVYMILSNYTILNTATGDSFSSQLGVDTNLMMMAYYFQKPILAVEGMQKQAEMFESFSKELMEFLIYSGCEQLTGMYNGNTASSSKVSADLKKMFESWKRGDVEAFEQLSQEDLLKELAEEIEELKPLADEYYTKLQYQRDDEMAAYIEQLLKSEGNGKYFVVLGSLHYISEYDIIDRLEEAGYTIEQIK